MKSRISIRGLVKELLENESLIVSYSELNDGGFDLSVRFDEEAFNTLEEINKINKDSYDKGVGEYVRKVSAREPISITCPYCGSIDVQYMYGTASLNTKGNQVSRHYICKDCHKEFDV